MLATHKTSTNAKNQANINYSRYFLLALGFLITLRMLFSDQESQSQNENKTLQLSFLFGLFQLSNQLMGSSSAASAISLANVLALLTTQAQPTSAGQLNKRQVKNDPKISLLEKYKFQDFLDGLYKDDIVYTDYIHPFHVFDLTNDDHFFMVWMKDNRAYEPAPSSRAQIRFSVLGAIVNTTGHVVGKSAVLIPETFSTRFGNVNNESAVEEGDEFFYRVSPVSYIEELVSKFYITWVDYQDDLHACGVSVRPDRKITTDFLDIKINKDTKVLKGESQENRVPLVVGLGNEACGPGKLVTAWTVRSNNTQPKSVYVRAFYPNGTFVLGSEQSLWKIPQNVPQKNFVIIPVPYKDEKGPRRCEVYQGFQVPYFKCESQFKFNESCKLIANTYTAEVNGGFTLQDPGITSGELRLNCEFNISENVYFSTPLVTFSEKRREYLLQLSGILARNSSTIIYEHRIVHSNSLYDNSCMDVLLSNSPTLEENNDKYRIRQSSTLDNGEYFVITFEREDFKIGLLTPSARKDKKFDDTFIDKTELFDRFENGFLPPYYAFDGVLTKSNGTDGITFIWRSYNTITGGALYFLNIPKELHIRASREKYEYLTTEKVLLGGIQIGGFGQFDRKATIIVKLQLQPPKAGELVIKGYNVDDEKEDKKKVDEKKYNPFTGEWLVGGTYVGVNAVFNYVVFVPSEEFHDKTNLTILVKDKDSNQIVSRMLSLDLISNRLPYLQYALIDFFNSDQANNKTLTNQNILAKDPDPANEDILFYAVCLNGYFTFENNATSSFTQRQINETRIRFIIVDRHEKPSCEVTLSDSKENGAIRTLGYPVGIVTKPLPHFTNRNIDFGDRKSVVITPANLAIKFPGNDMLNNNSFEAVRYYLTCQRCYLTTYNNNTNSTEQVVTFSHKDFSILNKTFTLFRTDLGQLPEAEIQVSDDGGKTLTSPVTIGFSGVNISPPRLLRSYVDFGESEQVILSARHFEIETFNQARDTITIKVTPSASAFYKINAPVINENKESLLSIKDIDAGQIKFVRNDNTKDKPECTVNLAFANEHYSQDYQMAITYTDTTLVLERWFNVLTVILAVTSFISLGLTFYTDIFRERKNRKEDVANTRLINYATFLSVSKKSNPQEKEKFEEITEDFDATRSTNASSSFFQSPQATVINGLKYCKLASNRNCLYHAVAFYLDRTPNDIRDTAVNHLLFNVNDYDLIIRRTGNTVNEYAQTIQTQKDWPGDGTIESEILMKVLERPILIIGNNGQLLNDARITHRNNPPVFVHYDGYGHYKGVTVDAIPEHRDATINNVFQRCGYNP